MRRLLVLLVALLLALFVAPAFALQEDPDEPVSDDDPVEQVDPEDEVVDDVDDYTDGCDYGGAEGDYEYCRGGGCQTGVDEDDYVYCNEAGGGGGPQPAPPGGPEPQISPVVETLDATALPLTGGNPGLVASFGAGLVLAGVGGRLRLSRR